MTSKVDGLISVLRELAQNQEVALKGWVKQSAAYGHPEWATRLIEAERHRLAEIRAQLNALAANESNLY